MVLDRSLPEARPLEMAAHGGRPLRASIIVVNYNGMDTIVSCLESLLATTGEMAEIIVVDNRSTDGSDLIIAERFPALRVIHSPANLGFGGGNNLGARDATGDYLVFLNPDAIATPGWWEALVDALASDASAGMATSRILLAHDPERLNTAGNDIHLTGLTLCRGMGRLAEDYVRAEPVSAISGAAFAIRRDLYQRLGGFDPEYFMYMEETDLSWRVQLAGYRCVYVPDSLVYHHYRLRFGPNKTFYQERNRYRMLLKTLRWPTLLLLLPALLLAEVVTWGYVLVGDRRHWTGKLRAYRSLFSERRSIRAARRDAQSHRVVPDRRLLKAATAHLDFAQTGAASAAALAAWVFNPLFSVWRWVLLGVVWW